MMKKKMYIQPVIKALHLGDELLGGPGAASFDPFGGKEVDLEDSEDENTSNKLWEE